MEGYFSLFTLTHYHAIRSPCVRSLLSGSSASPLSNMHKKIPFYLTKLGLDFYAIRMYTILVNNKQTPPARRDLMYNKRFFLSKGVIIMELNFYLCKHCGNVVEKVVDHKVPVICCGEKMQLLDPAMSEGAGEKHLPVLSIEGNQVKVSVGSVAHPMEEKHFIGFIALHTENGVQRKNLNPGDAPEAVFALADGDKVIAAYAYCNLHSLWKVNA